MGTTRWSDADYRSRAEYLRTIGRSAFGHDEDIRAQRITPGVHPLMDPSNLKGGCRESRDSVNHPASNAVAVLFDVTGSKQQVPRLLQKNLRTLFNLLIERRYLEDPAILVGGIGDATCDRAPLQIGQFESGNEIEDDLSRLFLEGGGGGHQTESYELALYFLARKTSIDCFEKRGRKGYAFIIGDEMPYSRVKRREVEYVFGDSLPADIPIRDIVEEARQKYEIYYVLPNLTSYYDDPKIFHCWKKLLGQNALRLEDPTGISELIAATIGVAQDAVEWNGLLADLSAAGTSSAVTDAVAAALVDVAPKDLRRTGLFMY